MILRVSKDRPITAFGEGAGEDEVANANQEPGSGVTSEHLE